VVWCPIHKALPTVSARSSPNYYSYAYSARLLLFACSCASSDSASLPVIGRDTRGVRRKAR